MKSIRDMFKNKDYLLEEPEVEKLLDYCESLEDQIFDFKFEKDKSKDLIMLDIIKEILKGCEAFEKEQNEHERFGYEPPNYIETIKNLKNYIIERCRDEKVRL
jgi:hypothetical protein